MQRAERSSTWEATSPALRPWTVGETARPPLPPEPSATPLTLGEQLHRKTLLGGFVIPSWLLLAALACTSAVAAGLLSPVLIAQASTDAPPALASSFGPIVSEPASVELSVIDRASAGAPDAMQELENKAPKERTIDDRVALANGRVARRRESLALLNSDLDRNPKLGLDPDVLRRLRGATEDPELAREALRILATLPGSSSVDVIYDVWIGTKGRTETTQLAEELVFVDTVRKKASPALSVALDLRDTTKCEDVSVLVDRAIAHGDRRSLRMLGSLTLRHGCGPHKSEDCYPCLRGDHRLTDAISAVLKRLKPKP